MLRWMVQRVEHQLLAVARLLAVLQALRPPLVHRSLLVMFHRPLVFSPSLVPPPPPPLDETTLIRLVAMLCSSVAVRALSPSVGELQEEAVEMELHR